jgi:N-acetylneuraminic acid mutarotase
MKKVYTIALTMLCIVAFTNHLLAQAWVQKTDLAGGWRYGAVGFSIGTKGYIGTGYGASDAQNDFWEYDPIANTWTQKANVGTGGRYQGMGFSVNGKGYIGCGDDSTGTSLQDFWEYDPIANTWTARADFPGGGRDGMFCFGIGTKGYAGSGGDVFGGTYNDFYEFDPATNTWTAKANFAGSARYFATGFSIAGLGYAGTGYDGFARSDLYEYNPATDVWTAKASCPGVGRLSAQSFSVLSKGYILCGQDNVAIPLGDCWQYDPATDSWLAMTDFAGTPRSGAAAFGLGNYGYYGTGDDGSLWNQDFYMFDPSFCAVTAVMPVIAGPPVVCGLAHATYTATSAGATSYTWTVPAGITIASGAGTLSIYTNIAPGTVNGNITCTASNTCGTSAAGTLLVTKKPQPPAVINGPASICGASTATYYVAPIFGATSYTWTLAAGLSIATGAGTDSITVNVAPGFIGGNIGVTGVNACGYVAATIMSVIGAPPATPGTLSGPSYVCGLTTAVYSVPAVTHATGYVWTVPSWMTITSGTGTNSITVSATGTPVASNISVAATDICGTGTARVLALRITSPMPGAITGPSNLCGLTTASYSVSSLGAGITYAWSVTATGWTITSGQGTNTITVTGPVVGVSAYAALVKVTSTNTCGSTSGIRTLGITACRDNLFPNSSVDTEMYNTSFSDIYPNPASTLFNIDTYSPYERTLMMEVYDILGNRIMQQKQVIAKGASTVKTNLEHCNSGMYFVRMYDENSNSIFTQRVIKE